MSAGAQPSTMNDTNKWQGRPINVLYVIDSLGTGGSERSLAEMLEPLAAEGIHPSIAVLSRRPQGVEEDVLAQGFDVRVMPSRGRIDQIRGVRSLIRRLRPDLVHTTLFRSDLAGRIAAAGTGVPVVTSLVNASYDPVRFQDPNVRAMRLRVARFVDGWTARHLTRHFHAVTRSVKDAAVRDLRLSPDRITVVERGRDPVRLGRADAVRRASARRRLRLEDDAEVVLTVGRQEFQKGQRYLVEAMAELARLRPRLTLVIAGRPGHASGELERIHRRTGTGNRVRFLGFVDDVPELLAAADLFAFPSLYEGLPGALIEAMAAGLPIVASDIDATREVLEPGGNAVLVPPGASDQLAGAIRNLLADDSARRTFAARSRSIFEARFTLEGSVRRMSAMYRDVLSGQGALR